MYRGVLISGVSFNKNSAVVRVIVLFTLCRFGGFLISEEITQGGDVLGVSDVMRELGVHL